MRAIACPTSIWPRLRPPIGYVVETTAIKTDDKKGGRRESRAHRFGAYLYSIICIFARAADVDDDRSRHGREDTLKTAC